MRIFNSTVVRRLLTHRTLLHAVRTTRRLPVMGVAVEEAAVVEGSSNVSSIGSLCTDITSCSVASKSHKALNSLLLQLYWGGSTSADQRDWLG